MGSISGAGDIPKINHRECPGFREYLSEFSPTIEEIRAAAPDIGVGTANAELKSRNMLLDDVKMELRIRHYSQRTEEAYVGWIRRFIVFNGKRHPSEMGELEIQAFLAHLAVERHVSASTQNQAVCTESGSVCGVIPYGKGQKDRVTMLPEAVKEPLKEHLQGVKTLHERDLSQQAGRVAMPDAIERKYPNANREWGWQWVFLATSRYFDKDAGFQRRHHLHESVVQRAMKQAVREAHITKPASCHTLRHSFATSLLESGYDIRTTGVARPQRCAHDHDLRTRAEPWRPRRQKSIRQSLMQSR